MLSSNKRNLKDARSQLQVFREKAAERYWHKFVRSPEKTSLVLSQEDGIRPQLLRASKHAHSIDVNEAKRSMSNKRRASRSLLLKSNTSSIQKPRPRDQSTSRAKSSIEPAAEHTCYFIDADSAAAKVNLEKRSLKVNLSELLRRFNIEKPQTIA